MKEEKKDSWNLSKVNILTLIIVTFFIIIFTLEMTILIFYTDISKSINIFLGFTALIFTFSFIGIYYSDNEYVKKYNLSGQFFRASQNFTISAIILLFSFSFSNINLLIESKNNIISFIGNTLYPLSTPIFIVALILLFFEVSTGTWIILKASFEAYKKYYNEVMKK